MNFILNFVKTPGVNVMIFVTFFGPFT